MNQRIKELADEAGADIWGDEVVITNHFDAEKFAKLIIKEYEQLLPDFCPWRDADEEGPMKGWHVQFVARKHFGVE